MPPALASYLGTGSPLVSQYCEKAEPLLCCAIEAQEHTLQLMEALQVALPFEQTDDKIRSLLKGLSETAYRTSEALTRSLVNVAKRIHAPRCLAGFCHCRGD